MGNYKIKREFHNLGNFQFTKELCFKKLFERWLFGTLLGSKQFLEAHESLGKPADVQYCCNRKFQATLIHHAQGFTEQQFSILQFAEYRDYICLHIKSHSTTRNGDFDCWGLHDSDNSCITRYSSDSSKEASHFCDQVRKQCIPTCQKSNKHTQNVKIFHINYLKEGISQVILPGSDLPRFLTSRTSSRHPMGTKQKQPLQHSRENLGLDIHDAGLDSQL